jgi:hypothetical protein
MQKAETISGEAADLVSAFCLLHSAFPFDIRHSRWHGSLQF